MEETTHANAEQRSLAMLVALHQHRDGLRRAALVDAVRRMLGDPELYRAPRANGDAAAPRALAERTVHRDLDRVREWLATTPWPAIAVEDRLAGRERVYRLARPLVPGVVLEAADRGAVEQVYLHLCRPGSGTREVVLPFLQKFAGEEFSVAIDDVLPPDVLGHLTPAQRAAVATITRAKREQRGITFAYRAMDRSREKTYIAWPLEVSSFGTRVYIGARKDDQQYRSFRLDRFVPRPDLPERHHLVRPTGHAAPFPLRAPERNFALRVTGSLVPYFRDTAVFPDQQVAEHGDGALTVRGTFRSEILLANAVLRYGALVELLEPKGVRNLIAAEVAALARVYADAGGN